MTENHLRSRIAWAPTSGFKQLVVLIGVGEPEVYYFDVLINVEKQVFRLEIPMDHINFVNVFNSSQDLLEEFAGLLFSNLLLLHNVIKQFPSTSVLHYQIQLARGLDDLIQLDNIRMPQFFQNLNFLGNPHYIRVILDLCFFENFNGHPNIKGRLPSRPFDGASPPSPSQMYPPQE